MEILYLTLACILFVGAVSIGTVYYWGKKKTI